MKNKLQKIIENKKASHVGMILSFVIFISFLVFIFSIFGSPINFSQSNEPLLNHYQMKINELFTSTITIITISPDNSLDKECIKVDNSEFGLIDLNTIVKDKDSNIVDSKISGDYLYFEWDSETFFKIYYSKKLEYKEDNIDTTDCYILSEDKISSFREDYYYDKSEILDFFSQYKANYTSLKSIVEIPANNDFGLTFIDTYGNEIKTQEKEVQTNIYSKEIPIQYFDEYAQINSGFINIRIW
ncbi:MAG: hypothetical protein OQK82_07470 [Candidatus Pacearchaeota archaeon]|nr:hypothetical protein [Candidatus Pacearchaeota archaeon]